MIVSQRSRQALPKGGGRPRRGRERFFCAKLLRFTARFRHGYRRTTFPSEEGFAALYDILSSLILLSIVFQSRKWYTV